MLDLEKLGWKVEHPARYGGKRNPGKFDAMLETNSGPIVLEWETGNISSSHRSLNKMALGITRGEILGGFLVVPSRAFAQYQTLSLARRKMRFESPILRSHISPRDLRIQRPKVRNSTQIRVVKSNRINPHIMR
jgi:hypothetical protein